jgi:hypothetical protein
VDLGQPVHDHIPEEQLAMTESDSEMSDSIQSSSDSDALGTDSEVVNSSDDDDEIAPLPSDAENDPSPDSSLQEEDRQDQSTYVCTALSCEKISRYICLFVLFIATRAIFQLSGGCHIITGDWAANLGLRSALRAFEQGIFIVPHLL